MKNLLGRFVLVIYVNTIIIIVKMIEIVFRNRIIKSYDHFIKIIVLF